MVHKSTIQGWSEFLDDKYEVKLLVTYAFVENREDIEEFAIVLLAIIDEKPVEIVRFDCSSKEAVNVHKFYKKPPEKNYLGKTKSFETMVELIEYVKKNWVKLKIAFFEK
jgi:hypothetical protein